MTKSFSLLASCALAALVLATGPARAQDAPSPNTVVAVVNGEEIKLGHMIVAYANLPEQYQQLPTDVLFQAIKDQLIRQTALSQQHSGTPADYVQMAIDNERRALLASETLGDVIGDLVSEDEIRAAYDAEYANVEAGDEYLASHILVETQEAAQAIKAELDGGADFAALAREKSTGPSGPNGGDLGWFGTGRMVPAFEAAVLELDPGQVSDPVQTQFGWHVIQLRDQRPVAAPTLDEVSDQLRGQLEADAVDAYVQGLVSEADVSETDLGDLPLDVVRDFNLLRN